MRRILLAVWAAAWILAGCSSDGEAKVEDLDFTVVADQEVPEELAQVIEEKKAGEFRLTYSLDDALYLVCGYGEQPGGGYSIRVNAFYRTENTLVLDTTLIGPEETQSAQSEGSEPYLVIKTALREEPVVFR